MNAMNANAEQVYSGNGYQESIAFQNIPGMREIMNADFPQREEMMTRYPDVAFALTVADNLFCGNNEQAEIHQRAYLGILRGENMKDVQFRYNRDMDDYVQRHMWDD